jgi:hypothetical protein
MIFHFRFPVVLVIPVVDPVHPIEIRSKHHESCGSSKTGPPARLLHRRSHAMIERSGIKPRM